MAKLHLTYEWLSFTRPPPHAPPPPPGIDAHFIDTPEGPLEIFSATPSQRQGPPVFFCHGGMGCAWVWCEYMQYLSARGVPCYAVSLRGHGCSWHPSYFKMLFGTPRRALEEDLIAAIQWVQRREDSEVLLVGHSLGGGLSQVVLANGDVSAKGLVLLASIPPYGSGEIDKNWQQLDPWFIPRLFLHGLHPNSPLSHPLLTKRVFFSDAYPLSSVAVFQRRLCRYETYRWALSLTRPFARADAVLGGGAGRVLVMAGTADRLVTAPVAERTAAVYRRVAAGGEESVRLVFVQGAGHQVQNDLGWEEGAEEVLKFWKTIV